jgi:hypothetical protein
MLGGQKRSPLTKRIMPREPDSGFLALNVHCQLFMVGWGSEGACCPSVNRAPTGEP